MVLPHIPEAKIPDIQLPTIRLPIHIPTIGCPGADAQSYIGQQFGSLPDLYDAFHAKHLRKVINDQIFALIKGKLPTLLRAGFYIQKAIELISDVAAIIQVLNQVVGQVIAEYNAIIGFINQKKAQLNAEIQRINGIGAGARTAVQIETIRVYQEYLGELDQQISRLQTSISCIVG